MVKIFVYTFLVIFFVYLCVCIDIYLMHMYIFIIYACIHIYNLEKCYDYNCNFYFLK